MFFPGQHAVDHVVFFEAGVVIGVVSEVDGAAGAGNFHLVIVYFDYKPPFCTPVQTLIRLLVGLLRRRCLRLRLCRRCDKQGARILEGFER